MATDKRKRLVAEVMVARVSVSTRLTAQERVHCCMAEILQLMEAIEVEGAAQVLKQTESDREVRAKLREQGSLLGPVEETLNPQG